MTPEVEEAVEEVRRTYPLAEVTAEPDGQGGAFVLVSKLALKKGKYNKSSTWIAFQITFQYPTSDVYPHFVDPELRLLQPPLNPGDPPLGEATSLGSYRDNPAIQISRKSPRRDPTLETAAIKLKKVHVWLNREQ